jgi:hypothetical protein
VFAVARSQARASPGAREAASQNVRRDGGQTSDATFSSGRADLARVIGLATGKQSKSIHFRVCPTTARFAGPIQDLSVTRLDGGVSQLRNHA